MPHVITTLCDRKGDCVEVCPVDCIVPGSKDDPEWGKYFYIDANECIDCGACVGACPIDGAIYPEEDLPAEHQADAQMNARYFSEGPGYREFDLEEERNP